MSEPLIDCPLSVTQEQYDALSQCEAIVVSEFEREDGTRYGNVIDWGDETEMTDRANTTDILILPLGIKSLGKVVVLVSDLIPNSTRI